MEKVTMLFIAIICAWITPTKAQEFNALAKSKVKAWIKKQNIHPNAMQEVIYNLKTTPNLFQNNFNSIVPKQKLDSAVSETLGFPELSIKNSYEYNASGLPVTWSNQEWNITLNAWVNLVRHQTIYDLNGIATSKIFFKGDQFVWNPVMKLDYLIDTNTTILRSLAYDWDSMNMNWKISIKDTFIYNQNGLLQRVENYIWNETQFKFEFIGKAEELYNLKDQLIMETGYSRDARSNQWINNFRTEWTYHPNDKIFQILSENWNESESDWIYTLKSEDYYNGSNLLIRNIEFYFDEVDNIWKNSSKLELQYDGNNNNVVLYYSLWDDVISKWDVNLKMESTYDNNFSYYDLVLPFTNPDVKMYFNHMLIKDEFYFNDQGSFIYDGNVQYYYSQLDLVKIKTIEPERLICFPNPTQGQLYLNLKDPGTNYSFTIFNSEGRLIKTIRLNDSNRIDLNWLNEGLYFYEIYENNNSICRSKLLVKR